MLLRILLLTVVMIAGVCGALIGAILIATGDGPVAGLIAGIVGLPVAVLSLLGIIRLNRRYQEQQLEEVLRDPTEIVARWPSDKGEVILARRGLFIGRNFHAFGGYQKLRDIDLTADGRTLRLEFAIVGADAPQRIEVEVAPDVVEVLREFFAEHRGGPRRAAPGQ
jgi:hypothetical protein